MSRLGGSSGSRSGRASHQGKGSLWRLFLLLIILGVLFWLSAYVTPYSVRLRDALLAFLGVGLALLMMWIVALVVTFELNAGFFWRRWNWWLGALCFSAGLLGLLAFFRATQGVMATSTLGGLLGQRILGTSNWVGGLRMALLFLASAALFAPYHLPEFYWKVVVALVRLPGWVATRLGDLFVRPAPPPPEMLEELGGAEEESRLEAEAKSPETKEEAVPAPEAPKKEEREETKKPFSLFPLWYPSGRGKEKAPPIAAGRWHLPPREILDLTAEREVTPAENERRARLLEEALASYGIEAHVVQINPGPTVTQFGVEPGWIRKYREVKEKDRNGNLKVSQEEISRTRVKVDAITALDKDLALVLAAPSIRIEAPVPGKSIVGIEVPNSTMSIVPLRSVIESSAFQRVKGKSKVAIALGKGAAGEAIAADLAKMPHLLIAGATGSGKSVCINSIIMALLLQATPDEVRFLLVDPKRVELVGYNSIPHLVAPVVVDLEKVMDILKWLNGEMDRRYSRMAALGVRNIEAYHKSPRATESMPYVLLIIDELADLMMTAPVDAEKGLCRLAQLGRATGIHLVLATQRPSVDVITGLIKANIPTRISFAVTSFVDSRTIIDQGGAEKLLGCGDMLYLPTDAPKPKRLQGAFVSDEEIERVVYFWAQQRGKEMGLITIVSEPGPPGDKASGEKAVMDDPLLDNARDLAAQHSRISANLLQRRLHIGEARAINLLNLLEKEGIIGLGGEGESRPVLKKPSAEDKPEEG